MILATALLTLAPALPSRVAVDEPYESDVAFALDQLEERCGRFFKLKDIDWKKVRREFSKRAKDIDDDSHHWELLVQLLARLEDGHASVRKLEAAKDVQWPGEPKDMTGPGLHLCRIGKKFYVKASFGDAGGAGIVVGSEVLKIDGLKMNKWVEARVARNRELWSYSTDQHALFHTLTKGLMDEKGTRIKLELKTPKGKKSKRTITYAKSSLFVEGPVFLPEGTRWVMGRNDSIRWGRTPNGYGYINVRRIKGTVLEEMDGALAELGDAPGIVLDFRGNTGGGCDHDALEARFVPQGQTMQRMARSPLSSAGPNPYGGPLIVIVDGSVVSAGETTSGMFKEDGRGYMIGESPTAGMSSQKETIELPSKLFELYVSVRSNRSSYNAGRGIEGIGVAPQEVVEYDPEELAQGIDTMIRRAEELLADFPQKEVRYDPEDYGWGK